jgi:hypothetical protein
LLNRFNTKHATDLRKEEYCKTFTRLKVLPFVPLRDLEKAYKLNKQNSNEKFNDIFDYFEKTWLGRSDDDLKPIIPRKYWNCYQRVLKQTMRSNNHIESWHNVFNNGIHHHPPVKRFIEYLQDVSNRHEADVGRVRMKEEYFGEARERRKTKRLFEIVKSYSTYSDLILYLDDINDGLELKETAQKHSISLKDYEEPILEDCEW